MDANISTREIRTPVKRQHAERYLLISLVSFALTVVSTRTFLFLTGYPQVGNGTLHIAHVLWGGLLLFVAALFPLLLANRYAFTWGAILSGAGVGLFIDEVGKFITQTNDYFYPPAAPIIYTFFLLTVLLYLRVKRTPKQAARDELYRIFDEMTEVLDCDLDSHERTQLELRLLHVAKLSDDPNLQRLVPALISFLEEEKVTLSQRRESRFERARLMAKKLAEERLSRIHLRRGLALAFGVVGVLGMIQLGGLLIAIPANAPALEAFLSPLVTRGQIRSANEAAWFFVRVFLQGTAGAVMITAGGLFLLGRERAALRASTLALVMWLTVINLLAFYYDQFAAVGASVGLLAVLLAAQYYRARFFK